MLGKIIIGWKNHGILKARYLVLQEQRHDVQGQLHHVVEPPLDDGHQVQPALNHLGKDVAQLGQQ